MCKQKTKFYTDLWHVLLGRHKIDDSNGEYPDYLSGGERIGKQTRIHTIAPKFQVRTLPKDKTGKSRFHMYNSDALWLTQWNLNTLWGLAYPSVLDEFSASFIEIAIMIFCVHPSFQLNPLVIKTIIVISDF